MSSGSYFPPPIKGVEIPKKSGGVRLLGIPTVGDRVAQNVVVGILESTLEPIFCNDSYGYRPHKSAHDAIAVTRERCWNRDWLLEFDIRGLFDNISHELLLKALCVHTSEKWILLYVERWLKVSIQLPTGVTLERSAGTPQGGCISPLLSNLFMHYAFDKWMQREHSNTPWCRYADDGLAHCESKEAAEMLLSKLSARMKECGLELHPDKTRIVQCNPKGKRVEKVERKFSFLGYEFRRRMVRNMRTKRLFLSFTPALCPNAMNSLRDEIRQFFRNTGTHHSLVKISVELNPKIRGWFAYYGKFNHSALDGLSHYINQRLMIWAQNKYLKVGRSAKNQWRWLRQRYQDCPKLFAHWQSFPVSLSGAG
jgi:RNA-directed DNA polymerase